MINESARAERKAVGLASSAWADGSELEQVQGLLRWTDVMVGELELLNLREVARVGDSWRPRLARLFTALRLDRLPLVRARPSPTELLNVLFDIQDGLLRTKCELLRRRADRRMRARLGRAASE